MQIVVNGEKVEVTDGLTVTQLLKEQRVKTPEYVSVELNGTVLDRKDFPTVTVSEGDAVEFLYFMGGG